MDNAATIIGVTPKGFHGTAFALDLDGYLTFSMAAPADPDMWTSRTDRRWTVMGRLKPGVSLTQAQSSVRVVAARLAGQYPATDKSTTVNSVSHPLSHPAPLPYDLLAS